MPKKDRSLPPPVETAAVTARVAGMSERAIYERLRDTLDVVPSYRDLRAAYAKAGVLSRRQAAAARREKRFPITQPSLQAIGERQAQRSDYLHRLKVTREVDKSAGGKDRLDQNFILGYMVRSGVDPESVADSAVKDQLEDIYDGIGS